MSRKQNIYFFHKLLVVIARMFFILTLNAQPQNLDYYLKAGLNNSPLLKDYSNRVKSALIDSMRIKAGQGIQVNASGINYYAPVIRGWGYDEIKTDIAEVSATVVVSKEVVWNKNLQNKYQALRLKNQSDFLKGNLSAKDLKKAIISQYIQAYGDQEYYNLNSEVLNFLMQEELIVKQLAEKGFYRQTEYLSFVVNIRQQELITDKSDLQLRTDHETLNYLCGIFDTARYVLESPGLTANLSFQASNSLYYRQFVIDSLQLVNNERQIDFDYQPKLSLFADGGYLSSLASTPWKNFGVSAGLSLTVPIYDGKQKKMQQNQIKISESTRSNYRDFFVNQYRQQAALLEHQLNSTDQITKKTIEQQKYTRALIDANRVLLDRGDIPVSDYLLSVNNYINTNSMLIENIVERFRIINELNYLNEK
jgi:outer membrane protein TolC